MEHFKKFYISNTFYPNEYLIFNILKLKQRSNDLITVLYRNEYAVGLITLKLACVIVTCHGKGVRVRVAIMIVETVDDL